MKKVHGWILNGTLLLSISVTGCASFRNSEPLATPEAVKIIKERDDLKSENQKLTVQLDELKSKLAASVAPAPVTAPQRTLPPATLVQAGAALQFKSKPPSKISSASFINNETTDRFREALIIFQSKKYSDAVVEFKEFVKSFGDHPLASRAQYLAGQAYFKQNEYGLASEEWNRVLVGYPHSSAIPETLAGMTAVSKSLGHNEESQYYEQKLNSHFAHAKIKIPSSKAKEASIPVPAPVVPEKPTAPEAPKIYSAPEIKAEPVSGTDSLDGLDQPTIKSVPVNLDEGEPE